MDSLDFCVQCSPEIGNVLFFEKTPQKPMRNNKANSFPMQQRAKTRVSAHYYEFLVLKKVPPKPVGVAIPSTP